MKFIQITAGTGNYYCGACIRDNAMVRALRDLGHETVMVPLYLPFVTDEADSCGGTPIFFGGINLYLQHKSALFRRTPRWIDRILDSRPLLRWAAGMSGMTEGGELGEMTLSMLRGEEGRQVKELRRLLEWLRRGPRPDVIGLSNALFLGMAPALKRELGVPLLCTLQGEDVFLDSLPEPYRGEAWAAVAERASDIDAFIPVSHYYGGVMHERAGIPADKIHVVYNGISLDGFDSGDRSETQRAVGYLARLCPDKGLDTLIEAFIHLKLNPDFSDVRLHVAGVMTASDEPFVKAMRARLAQSGHERDAEIVPNITRDRKIEFLNTLSVFSVPALYGESFGLYVVEAMAAGIPVVQPRHASFPELLEVSGGGILYEGEGPAALAAALAGLLSDPDKARALGVTGRDSVFREFGADRMARDVVRVCQDISGLGDALPERCLDAI